MQEIKRSLELLDTNLTIIRSNDQKREEIKYEVWQRHDVNGTIFNDIASLINEVAEALIEHHAWNGDNKPSECRKCDNCQCRIKDNPSICDVTFDIVELLCVEVLTTTYDHQITPADVVSVFRQSNAARMKKFGYQQLKEFYDQEDIKKSKKPELLSTIELTEFALQDLVRKGLVLQDIVLSRLYETEYMSCTLVIEGIANEAKEIIKVQEWKYFK
ncbi:19505_t:CDS:2, partial [Dentiscutata erythropus]